MSKLTIVIIEDEKNILSFIEAALETHDYKVLTAVSGKEGLSLINACCPDMILLDLGLPDLDGIDIIKNVRSWSSIPIIVISARTQEQEKVAALDFGADDYITKPFGTSELMAAPHSATASRPSAPETGNSFSRRTAAEIWSSILTNVSSCLKIRRST
jgi:two-component system KDP operon response regulator KdpE